MTFTERRRSPRYDCSADTEIVWGSEVLRAKLHDIGATGMFIETPNPLWVHAEFAARVLLPEPLSVNCVVRRVHPGRGMGVEFTDIPVAARQALEKYIWTLAGK